MSTLTTFLHTRRRLLLWLGGVLTGYALLGFLLLPWLVETQLSKFLSDRVALETEVESVYFNPFSFYFAVEGLQVTDPGQSSLVDLGGLTLNFQPSRLLLLKLQFSEISVNDLQLYYARESDGADTVSRLAQRWLDTATAVAEPEESAGELVPLEILALSVSNIRLHIEDAVPETPFVTTLVLAQARIENFSTLPDNLGNNVLALQFEQGARLSWRGGFSITPLTFDGDIALENFSLSPVSRYLQDTLPFQLQDGRVDLAFRYAVDLSREEPSVTLDEIVLALNDLAVLQNETTDPFLEAANISLNGGRVQIPQNRAEFDALVLRELSLNGSRDAAGLVNLQVMLDDLLPASPDEPVPTAAATAEPASPWLISLTELSLAENRLHFSDGAIEQPFVFGASLNVTLRDIDNQEASRFPLAASLVLDSGGDIDLQGTLQVLPAVAMTSDLTVSELALALAQPYVNEVARLELAAGTLNLEAELLIDPEEPFSYRGGVALRDVRIEDLQLSETLLSMDSLGIDALSLSLGENNLDISEVALESFFARVQINEDGTSNLSRSLRTDGETAAADSAATEAAEEDSTTAEPLAITVGLISLNEASAHFTDRNLPLEFNAQIEALNGQVQGFATNSSEAADLEFEGRVDEFGLVQIGGRLRPLDPMAESEVQVNFTNIDMPSMTPYTIKFAGREIESGTVDVTLSYNVVEGELLANNQVVLSQLVLGDRVEYPDAMDLPLDLALALLKDSNGEIDLEVPVTGNVNDPEFSFGPAIRRAVSNILGNLVAAPFRLLGNLIGGGGDGDSLETIRFLPGRVDIAAPEQQVLLQLSEALKQRPQLVLEIPPVSASADRLALQEQAVEQALAAALQAQPESEDSLTVRRRAATESLYAEAGLQPPIAELQTLHTPVVEVAEPNVLTAALGGAIPGELDVQAYLADIRQRLVAAEAIAPADLAALAQARRQAVIEFMVASGGIAPGRLRESEAQDSELDDEGWLPMKFGLGPL